MSPAAAGRAFTNKFEKKIDYGASLMAMGSGPVGFEIDFGYSPNFFETDTTGSGFEFTSDSNVTTLMGNHLGRSAAPGGGASLCRRRRRPAPHERQDRRGMFA